MIVSLPRNPLSPLSRLPIEGLEEALIREEVEKEDSLDSLDNLIDKTDLPVIEEDLDLDNLLKSLTKVLTTRGPMYRERLLTKTK